MSNQPILVIGSTGKTGSRVAARLEQRGEKVRHGSRRAPIPFDWDTPETWSASLDGVSAAYVTYFPDLAFPGAVDKVEALCRVAKSAGLQRIVLLSGRGEHHARLGEEAVRASGLDFTLVRASWFAQNFSEGYLRDPVLNGVLPMPGGDVAEPIVDVDDIADVAVAALTQDRHSGELYEVTGPRLLTFAEMAAILSDATGRTVQHVPISFETFHQGLMDSAGEFIADVFTGIALETLDGRNASLCDGGVFLAFSDFIMRALSQTSGTGGLEAMQSINQQVFRWVFMSLFLGMAPVSLVLAGVAWTHLNMPGAVLLLLSGLLYLAGCLAVTIVCNVPMNERLAALKASDEAASAYWTGIYLPRWTFWNTVRTAACILAAALQTAASGAAAQTTTASHLAGSTSPYLLQHLDNPVDWYPWGQKALDRAKAENRLILVSVGYASCHWCHVMEEESFMNEEIAALLNRDFISIKIDRESRPDLDEQFMTVTQMITGGGGWPNTVFLTPDGAPFFATTYVPAGDLKDMLGAVREAFQDEPDLVAQEARRISQAVSGYLVRKAEAREITPELIEKIASETYVKLDPFHGGYGTAPKFPRETLFHFLLDHAERTGEVDALAAVTNLLDGMIRGGIHDQVGGGFHRYAIDPEWHVPHFEKMLYTQALTGRLLVRTWQITGEPRYRRAAERLFAYVLADLRGTEGAFYSAQDADSRTADGTKAEGSFYTWTPDQIAALGDDQKFVRDLYGISENGNFEGTNILTLNTATEDIAADYERDPGAFQARLDKVLDQMKSLRSERAAPPIDRKIVVSWNAVMIQTLAEAGYILKRPDYLEAAATAAAFISKNMLNDDGLKRVFFEGETAIPGQLADYAGLGLAFLALHDFSPDPDESKAWLRAARSMAGEVENRFGTATEGYNMTQSVDGVTRIVPLDDTELPSGNALALTLFARLSQRLKAPELELTAFDLASALSGHAADYPDLRGYLLTALRELQWGGTGTLRFAGGGHVRVILQNPRPDGDIRLSLSIADGWHINAHTPITDFVVPTEFTLDGHETLQKAR
eukprot:g1064.t1